MDQPFTDLCRTFWVNAASATSPSSGPVHFHIQGNGSAFGNPFLLLSCFQTHSHFRNNIACLFNDDLITKLDILFTDQIFIMKRGPLTVVPATCTGSRTAVGVMTPVRPTFNSISNKLCDNFFRREFIGNCPARAFCCCPKLFLLAKGIHFDDNPINFIGKIRPFFRPALQYIESLLQCLHIFCVPYSS